MADQKQFYELYRRSSVGMALTDTLDQLISDQRLDPQLAMKVIQNFDKAVSEVLNEKVKSRMSFKGHLDTYRFCDDVWTFIIKDINFKLDNSQQVHSDRIKIVSCSSKRPELEEKSQRRKKRTLEKGESRSRAAKKAVSSKQSKKGGSKKIQNESVSLDRTALSSHLQTPDTKPLIKDENEDTQSPSDMPAFTLSPVNKVEDWTIEHLLLPWSQ